jgi:adenosylcobinamide-phosphate synthase
MTPSFLLLAAAVLLDLILGDPAWLTHPVTIIGKVAEALEKLFRGLVRNERLAGTMLLIITVGGTYAAVFAILRAAFHAGMYAGWGISLFLAWTCIAARSLHLESRKVARALDRDDLPEARRLLSFIVGRDTENLDAPEIRRALVETVAENTSDGVIAPLFYLAIGGPALAMAYKAVNTLDSMVGYRNDRYLRFGWASARFDDLANFIPARLTALLMALAAPLVGLSFRDAFRTTLRDGRNHSSPNAGWPEAAAAGALGVQLGGTNFYFGKPVAKPTIGDAHRPLSAMAYRGVVRLLYGAELLFLLMAGAGTVLLRGSV